MSVSREHAPLRGATGSFDETEARHGAGAVTGDERSSTARSRPGPGGAAWARFGVAVVAFVGFIALVSSQRPRRISARTLSGVTVAGEAVAGVKDASGLRGRLADRARKQLDAPLVLLAGNERIEVTPRALGVTVDEKALDRQVRRLDAAGVPTGETELLLPLAVPTAKSTEIITRLKEKHDRVANDAKLDLEHRKVLPEERGVLLNMVD